MLDKILPEDLRQKVRDSSAKTRREVFSGIREELYRRAVEFGEDLYQSFLENPDISYESTLEAVNEELGLSDEQKRLYFDIVDLANKDVRNTQEAKNEAWLNKSGITELAKNKGLISDESEREEVLGVVFYYALTGLWPKGRVTLIDANSLAVELHIKNDRDLAGIYEPKDVRDKEAKGEDTSNLGTTFGGFFRKDAHAFNCGFPLVVTSGEDNYRLLVEKHEHSHHLNSIVSEALGRDPKRVIDTGETISTVTADLVWVEEALAAGVMGIDQAKILYKRALETYLMTAFECAKDELLAGYAGSGGDILTQIGEMIMDKVQDPDTNYDYIQMLYSDKRWERLPKELRDIVREMKGEYWKKMSDQAYAASVAFNMLYDFGSKDGVKALQGLLQTVLLLRWESEIKKVYGEDLEAYREYVGFEDRIYFHKYFESHYRRENGEERNEAFEKWSSIRGRFQSIKERMLRKINRGQSLHQAFSTERSRFEGLEKEIKSYVV